MVLLENSTKHLKNYTNPAQTGPKIEEKVTLPNSFSEASITLTLESDKDTTGKGQAHISDEY